MRRIKKTDSTIAGRAGRALLTSADPALRLLLPSMALGCIDRKALFQGHTQARETQHCCRGLQTPGNLPGVHGVAARKTVHIPRNPSCYLVIAPDAWREYSNVGWQVSVKLLEIREKFQWLTYTTASRYQI